MIATFWEFLMGSAASNCCGSPNCVCSCSRPGEVWLMRIIMPDIGVVDLLLLSISGTGKEHFKLTESTYLVVKSDCSQ